MSVPAVTLRPLSEEPNQSTPRAAEFSKPTVETGRGDALQSAGPNAKAAKRSSSLMTKELAPLIIPFNGLGNQNDERQKLTEKEGEIGALPPRVPPKSPRTERRASPRADRSQHSAHSSLSTNYSTASSAASSSGVFGRASPRLTSDSRRIESPLGRSGPMSAVDKSSPDSIWSKLFRLESPSRQQRAAEILEKPNAQSPQIGSDRAAVTSPHQRWLSDASAVSRGRLARKDSLAYHNHRKSSLRSPSTSKRSNDLPTGFNAAEVPHQVADMELRGLRQQAEDQVSKFEVLQAKDVSMLSKVRPSSRREHIGLRLTATGIA